jgi:hypothetical protein
LVNSSENIRCKVIFAFQLLIRRNDQIKLLFIALLWLTTSLSLKGQACIRGGVFPPGSCIIDMGITPQTIGNGLKPYGLLYQLVNLQKIPVIWSILPGKAFDGIDFSIGARNFRGGPFIISAEYITPAIQTLINNWVAKGVVVYYSPVSFTPPVYDEIDYLPKVVLDAEFGYLIENAFYIKAEIPVSSYTKGGIPSNITICDDIYVMPHANPLGYIHQPYYPPWPQAQRDALYNFVTNIHGWLWASCAAVSQLEAIFGGSPSTQMNFLSTTGLVDYQVHIDPAFPNVFNYNPAYASDPFMQFMGTFGNALYTGDEKVFIPKTTWRNSTTIAVTNPSFPIGNYNSSGPAVELAWGNAYGNINNGMVMYMAGHDFLGPNGTTAAQQVSVARVYGDFWIRSGIKARPSVTISGPATVIGGQTITLTASSSANSSWQWTSNCGGAFSTPTSSATGYTAPTVLVATPCNIQVSVADACGRRSYGCLTITVLPSCAAVNPMTTLTCSGTAFSVTPADPANGTIPTGTTYSWPAPTVTGGITGGVSGSGAASISGSLINPTNTSQTATYNVTPLSGSCTGSPFALTVTVNPKAAINNMAISACSGVSFTVTPIDGTNGIVPAGTTYSWGLPTGSGFSGGATGSGASSISGTLTNTSGSIATATYTITPSGTCAGGTFTLAVTVKPLPATPSPVLPATQPTCDLPSGSVVINGLPTGNWTINPGAIAGNSTTAIIYGLAAGTYNFRVTDATGCTSLPAADVVIFPYALSENPPTVGTITPPTCIAGSTGSVVLNGLPTPGNWTLVRTPAAPNITFSGSSYTITGLSPGTYTYQVRRTSGGCLSAPSAIIDIPQPIPPITPTFSCTAVTGSIIITAPLGGTYEYNIDGGPWQASVNFAGIVAGTHNILARIAANPTCISSPATLNIPAIPTTSGIIQPLCTSPTGSVTLNGLPAGNWIVNPGAIAGNTATTTISGLAPGTYNFSATNSAGCISGLTGNVVLFSPGTASAPPTVGLITQPCISLTGSVELKDLPTPGNWTLVRTPAAPNITFSGSSYTVTPISPGTYTYQVRLTAGGCLSPPSASFVINPALAVSISGQTNVNCFGNSSGSATVTATGGTPPLTYSWNTVPEQTTATAVGLSAGTYIVTVTDGSGCIKTASATITEPSQLTASITANNVLCSGGSTGSATVNVTGGTPAYTYSWNTSPVQTTATVTGLAPGTYDVTVTDAKGCSTISTVSISQPAAPLVATIGTPVNVVCFGNATGSATASATGGTEPYSYSWNTLPVQTTATANNLPAGTYIVTVTDANGCTATATTTITQPSAPMSITAQPLQQTDCYGNHVEFSVTVTGASGTPVYQWQQLPPSGSWTNMTDDANVTGSATSLLAINNTGVLGQNVSGTEYRVLVTDACPTLTSNTALLTLNSITDITPTDENSTICSIGGSISYTVTTQGTTPVGYQWSFDNGTGWIPISNGGPYSGALTSQLTISNATSAQSGSYRVSVTFNILNQPPADGLTCVETSFSRIRNLVVRQILTRPVISSSQSICINTAPSTLTATAATGGSGPFNYQWQTSPDGLFPWTDIPGAITLSYSPPSLSETTFYRIVATDIGTPGCGSIGSTAVEITVNPLPITSPIYHQ